MFKNLLHAFSRRRGAPEAKAAGTMKNSIGMTLSLIPAGEFLMGSSSSDSDAEDDERPQHHVRITEPFYIQTTEVTQDQWQSVMETQPWKGKSGVREGNDHPATCVSWDDATAFCQRLSQRCDTVYRLPTEAEWEYACRAGSTSVYSFGDDPSLLSDHGWWGALSGRGNLAGELYGRPVGQKRPNAFGLYDMHGNVFEWCGDWYGGDYYASSPSVDPQGPSSGADRVTRGGSWFSSPRDCRAASRTRFSPDYQINGYIGLRVVCSSMEGTGSNGTRIGRK